MSAANPARRGPPAPAKNRAPQKPTVQPPPPRDSFQVVIQCAGEQEQERLYNELRSRGLTVRVLTM